jgi:hypothetical protein
MKPTTMTGYSPETTSLARNTVLSLATWLGDLKEDVVIVGGLVPSLLVGDPPDGVEPHAGTLDVDLALHLAVLDDERYTKISDRLRRAGAGPSLNADGKPTPQKWCLVASTMSVEIDFLIGPATPASRAGGIHHLETDFFGASRRSIRTSPRTSSRPYHSPSLTVDGARSAAPPSPAKPPSATCGWPVRGASSS